MAFVNFLCAHWSSVYHFGPLLQENSISSLHSEPRKELIEQRTVRSGRLFFQPPAAPAPNKAVALQRPKGCVHTHPAAPRLSCLRRMGAGRLVPSCTGKADQPWTTCAGAGLLCGPGGNRASQVCQEEDGAVSMSLPSIMWHAFSAKAFKKCCSSLRDYRKKMGINIVLGCLFFGTADGKLWPVYQTQSPWLGFIHHPLISPPQWGQGVVMQITWL